MRTANVRPGAADMSPVWAALDRRGVAVLFATYSATERCGRLGFPRTPWRVALLVEQALERITLDGSSVGQGFAALSDPHRGVRDGAVSVVANGLALDGWLVALDDGPIGVWRVAEDRRDVVRDRWATLRVADRVAIDLGAQRALAILDAWSKKSRA